MPPSLINLAHSGPSGTFWPNRSKRLIPAGCENIRVPEMWVKRSLVGLFTILALVGALSGPATATESSFSFSLQGSSLLQCWFYAVGFTAGQGEQFVILWNETNFPPISVNFYIVPRGWLNVPWNCLDGPQTLYFNDGAIGTATWAAPVAGNYAVVLVNYSASNVSGAVSIAAMNATVSANPIGYGAVLPYRCRSPDPITCIEPPS